jgi:hypothetical protein
MSERVILRTKSHLSYAGEICENMWNNDVFIIKPSEISNIKIWFPIDEVECIIKIDGNILEGELLVNECRLYQDI